jgi:uncharacterized RDD family membrane protein YckC
MVEATVSDQTQAQTPGSVAASGMPDQEPEYAGFWIRFGARIIDGVILVILFIVIAFIGGLLINTIFPDYAENEEIYLTAIEDLTARNLETADNPFSAGFDAGISAATCDFTGQREVDACEEYTDFLPIASAVIMALQGAAYLLYYVVLTATGLKGSLGKSVFKLKVVNDKNETISFGQSLARESFMVGYFVVGMAGYFLWLISILSNIFWIGFIISSIVSAFDEKKQALHDRLAKTFVIKAS